MDTGLRAGASWRDVVIHTAFVQAALGNAAILRELMQRSEPQGAEATGEITLRVVYGNGNGTNNQTPGATPKAT